MNKPLNILIYPSGGENALDVHTALKDIVNIKVYGASTVDNHTRFKYKNILKNPPSITDTDFISRFNKLLDENKIDIVIPCHDSVSEFLAKINKDLNAIIATSKYETTHICRYKSLTYDALKHSKYCPKIFNSNEEITFPVFIKPNKGEGSRNAQVVNTLEDFNQIKNLNPNTEFVVSEYLPGEEFTVDCFTDRHGQLKFVGPRTRSRVFGGISTRSETVSNERFTPVAEDINDSIDFRGLWYFQCKEDLEGNLKILEISTRASGTMNVYRQRGINFPLLTVYDALDYEISIIDSEFDLTMDRSFCARYSIDVTYNHVYLDFDDTLLMHYGVNTTALSFVYQCIQKDIPIHLITKHEKDLDQTMKDAFIPKELFQSIIHLQPTEDKYKFIEHKDSIFIDNAFQERKAIHEKLGIPVFDVDAIDCLMDSRL